MKLISVIIPHKNTPYTLIDLIETIPDNPKIQIIIVDDQSCLKTKEILNYSFQPRTNVEIHHNTSNESNAGKARNIGLCKALGKWVLFADADDIFTENAFAHLERSAISYSEADTILFRCTASKEDGSISNRSNNYTRLLDEFPNNENEILYHWVVPWGKLIKKELINDNNIFFSSCLASNDVMFSTYLAYYASNIAKYDACVYCCFQREGSLSSSIDEKKALSRLNILIERNQFLISNNVDIKLHNGFTYFFKSNPLKQFKEKKKTYYLWVRQFALRMERYCSKKFNH